MTSENVFNLSNDFTISFSMKSQIGLSNYNPIFYKGPIDNCNESSELEIYIGNGGITIIVNRGQNSVDNYFTNPFNYEDWLDVTITSQNNIYTIYFDGQFSESYTLTNVVNQSYPIAIGYLNWDQNGNNQCDENEERYFNGKFDNFHIWDYSQSSIEINSYISCPPNGDEDGLLYFFDFENDENSVVNYSFSSDVIDYECLNNNNSSENIIGDLNCDDVVNQLDALILNNLILEIGDTPSQLEENYPCLNENLNGLSIDNIQSLQSLLESIESNTNTNFTNTNNLSFPQGYNGKIIYWDNGSNSYVVPNDSVLYITNIYSNYGNDCPDWNDDCAFKIEDNTIYQSYSNVNPNEGTNSLPYSWNSLKQPIMVGSNKIVNGDGFFHGMLFKKTLEPFIIELHGDGGPDYNPYIVPQDSILVILNAYQKSENGDLRVDNNIMLKGYRNNYQGKYNGQLNIPLIVFRGSEVKAVNSSFPYNINGYIVHKDYFTENNSVSTENEDTSTNAPIDLGSQDSEFEIIDLKLDQTLTPIDIEIDNNGNIYIAIKHPPVRKLEITALMHIPA